MKKEISSPLAIFLAMIISSCGGPGSGVHATALKQVGGGHYISVSPGAAKQEGVALEAFHKKAQRTEKAGTYSYVYQTQKHAHARTTGGIPIPYGAGPVLGGAMLLGNVAAMQTEKPSTFTVNGNTTPQAPLSISKGSRVGIKVTTSPDAITVIDETQKTEIRSCLATALQNLGLSGRSSGSYTLEAKILRSSSKDSWYTIELDLKSNGSRQINKGFLMAKGDKTSTLQETLARMCKVK